MQYRKDINGKEISILGYGCMRFSKKGTGIDIDKAEKEVMEAIHSGVNYFDTAYLYPGSEATLGEILQRNQCREKINIATKLPIYLLKSKDSIDKFFNVELKRLKTDYVDYYLMHMITDITVWDKLVKLGIIEWIKKKKESGQIRNIGFSFHGSTDKFLKVLNAYDWDFCQIQYNYMDENSQAGRKGLVAANEKGIPVIIMEPLRGGKLVNLLPEKALKLIAENPKKRTPAEWALRWLWNQPQVTCVLSGMNSMEMVKENIRIASDSKVGEFTSEDDAMIAQIKVVVNESIKVGCTGCAYCMPCPQGVDIPTIFRCYNEMYTEGKRAAKSEYIRLTAVRKKTSGASACIGCGKCERHCPQNIKIREELKNARKNLEGVPYKVVNWVTGKFM